MSVSLEWLLGLIYLLVFGAYGWSTFIAGWLNAKVEDVRSHFDARLDELRDNHIKHLEERVSKLEKPDESR